MEKASNLIEVYNYLGQTDSEGNFVHSGASYNIFTGDFNPDSGYMVALDGYERTVGFPSTLNSFQEIMIDYLQGRVLKVMGDADIYLGFWFNEGVLCIDISERIEDEPTAIKVGLARNQKAIWDANNQREIFLKKVSNDPDIQTDKRF
jgi:hypothetical protein